MSCTPRRYAITGRILQRQRRQDRATPPPRPGGVRRSDRSDMGCSHARTCPLFPLLKASLRGWRESYCDSEERWHECARHKLASRGQLVPISLLPNGADVGHIRKAAERSAAAEPTPPSPLISGANGTAAWFEPAPRPEPARPRDAPARPREPSVQSQTPQVPRTPPPAPRTPSAPDRGARPRRTRGSKRRWWTRLAEWMRDAS